MVMKADRPDVGRSALSLTPYPTSGCASAIVFHEYVHDVANLNMWNLPMWFSEGLAQFYESFEVVGEVAPDNAWAARFEAGYCVEYREPGELMVSQEVDQLQGLETVEPSVKL